MKFFVALTLLSFSSISFADFKCNKSVDPKRVVLFVDTNDSPKEIEGAAKAACERGESFRKFPDKTRKELDEIPWDSKHDLVSPSTLNREVASLAKQDIAVTSMVVSGHDGGGRVHGDHGEVDKYAVISAMKKAYKGKKHLLNEMKSVFMWGCWSMGPSEVEVWKKELPNLKLTAGFMDMGPLNTTEASHSVLNGLLVKEKSLIAEADAKKLKRAIQGIPNINVTLASVYTEAACGDMMYYKTEGDNEEDPDVTRDNPLFARGTHFVDYNESFDCKAMAKGIEEKRKELLKYYYGQVPLPEDKPGSPIREIYSFLRHAAKCLPPNHILNADRIFLLRFYNEVKQNFAKTFDHEITYANKEYVGLNSLLKNGPKNADRTALMKYMAKHKGKYFNPRYANLKGKSRKEIQDMISYLDGLVKQPYARDPRNEGYFGGLKRLRNAMDKYLFQLDPKCMNFMEWHEVTDRPPYPLCPI
jgi:hypothetical protein